MKSIYDLIVPSGYVTEFQYFYGYQIDQIRNLIAHWAKQYDYLFSVDSDIVLPNDSLIKMLNADKDIVSGLYIQRIPNTHTLEIYKPMPNGGCTNMPIQEIQGRGLVKIAACGMGCALIKSDVFRKMPYPQFYYKSALDHKNTVSEDVYFCMKASELGFEIWADETIRCDHVGQTHYRVQNAPVEPAQELTHLQRVAQSDLLPQQHVEYLQQMNIAPRVIYDIGACVLHWTRHAVRIWPDAEIYTMDAAMSVEPFLKNSGLPYAIEMLSDRDGETKTFYEDTENPGGNSYYLETTGAFTQQHATTRISKTLDTLVKERGWPLPDLIKIDAQGAEMDILLGAENTIKNCQDVILEAQHVEYNQGAPNVHRVHEYMQQLGFELVSNFCLTDVDGDYHYKRKV
jgi:FkbM family methyltransferase